MKIVKKILLVSMVLSLASACIFAKGKKDKKADNENVENPNVVEEPAVESYPEPEIGDAK